MQRTLLTAICSFILLLMPVVTYAATISPDTLEIVGVRGEQIQTSFEVWNTGMSEQTYFLDTLTFTASEEEGVPLFVQGKTEDSLASWIKFPLETIVVPAQSKVVVPITVAIPDDVSSGGYYAAATVGTAPTEVVASNGAAIESKTAVLLLLTVEGETVRELELVDVQLEQIPGVHIPAGSVLVRVQNQGNVHVTPEGVIHATNLFGRTIEKMSLNEEQGRILPSTTRTLTARIGNNDLNVLETAGYQMKNLLIGPVTYELTLTDGYDQTRSAEITQFYMPVELLGVFIAFLSVLVVWNVVIKSTKT